MINDQNSIIENSSDNLDRFGILNFGIVIYLIFVICDL